MKSWAPHPSSCSCLGDEGRSFPAMSWPFGTRIRVFLGLQGFSPVIEANLREDSSGPSPGNVESHVYRDISWSFNILIHQLISNRGHGHYIDANPSDALIKGKSSLLKIGHFNDPSFKNLPNPANCPANRPACGAVGILLLGTKAVAWRPWTDLFGVCSTSTSSTSSSSSSNSTSKGGKLSRYDCMTIRFSFIV